MSFALSCCTTARKTSMTARKTSMPQHVLCSSTMTFVLKTGGHNMQNTENSLRRTQNDVSCDIEIRLPYIHHSIRNFSFMCSDARQFAVVALLDPEGFTSNKSPARPDVSFKSSCHPYRRLLLTPSNAVHCQVLSSCVGCLTV